jgi:hypothetical protein
MEAKERLLQLGIEVSEDDEAAVAFAEGKVYEHIGNVCNVSEVPAELEYTATDMVCCEFIKERLISGLMDDVEARGALKAITEGDVKVEYDSDSGKSTQELLTELLEKGEADLYRFRKMCW